METTITTNPEAQAENAGQQALTLATMLENMRAANNRASDNAATVGSNASNLSKVAGDKMTDGMIDALTQIEKQVQTADIKVDIDEGLAQVASVMKDAPRHAVDAVIELLKDQAQLGPQMIADFVANTQRQIALVKRVNGAELVASTLPVVETVTAQLTPDKVARVRQAADAINATEALLGDIDDVLPKGESCGRFKKFPPKVDASEAGRILAKAKKAKRDKN